METVTFLVLSVLAVATAIAVVTEKRPVYCALYFIVNLIIISLIYLTLSSEFIAVIQVIIYAGAVMVLFLFVIMMLTQGAENFPEKIPWQKFLTIPLLLILLLEIGYVIITGSPWIKVEPALFSPLENFGKIATLGHVLFTEYLLPFEMTSLILLVAIIGAVYLGKKERDGK